jgi:hypothetical protein
MNRVTTTPGDAIRRTLSGADLTAPGKGINHDHAQGSPGLRCDESGTAPGDRPQGRGFGPRRQALVLEGPRPRGCGRDEGRRGFARWPAVPGDRLTTSGEVAKSRLPRCLWLGAQALILALIDLWLIGAIPHA